MGLFRVVTLKGAERKPNVPDDFNAFDLCSHGGSVHFLERRKIFGGRVLEIKIII